MKILKKNITSISLIAISLVLLTGFNIFWLIKNYQEQKIDLTKEVDSAFEKTITSMQDSLIQRQLQIPKIEVKKKTKQVNYKKDYPKVEIVPAKIENLSKEISQTVNFLSDSLPHQISDSVRSSKVSIFISTTNKISPDSLRMILGKLTSGVRKKNESASITLRLSADSIKSYHWKSDTSQPRKAKEIRFVAASKASAKLPNLPNFVKPNREKDLVFILNNDSLKVSEILTKYRSLLEKNQIKLPFEILKTSKETTPLIKAEIMTQMYPSGFPIRNYYAVFDNFEPFLVKKILPEILFSLFLIGITGLSFGLIFTNLQKQRRLTALKNDFISNVTHELKTPISTVGVAIEALSNFNVLQNPQQTQEYLSISKNELNRLSMLVDKVLKMSIFEQKELVLEKQEINLKTIVESVLSSMKIQFEKYQTQVNFDYTGENFSLVGDSIHLTNVVYNLLDNALKYQKSNSNNEGKEIFIPQIEINLTEKENSVEIAIQDNGIGIPKEYQQRVFEKFFRVPTGDIHNIKGYGLGLSYVKNVVEKHDGKITVESTENQGSKFVLNFKK